MLRFIYLLLILFMPIAAHAQLAFGILGGHNDSNITGDFGIYKTTTKPGYQLGLVTKWNLIKDKNNAIMNIRGGLIYASRGAKVNWDYDTYTGKLIVNYLEIPIKFDFQIPIYKNFGIDLFGGFYGAIALGGFADLHWKTRSSVIDSSMKIFFKNVVSIEESRNFDTFQEQYTLLKRTDYGLTGGIMIYYKIFHLEYS